MGEARDQSRAVRTGRFHDLNASSSPPHNNAESKTTISGSATAEIGGGERSRRGGMSSGLIGGTARAVADRIPRLVSEFAHHWWRKPVRLDRGSRALGPQLRRAHGRWGRGHRPHAGTAQLATGETIPYAYGLRLGSYRGLRTVTRGGYEEGTNGDAALPGPAIQRRDALQHREARAVASGSGGPSGPRLQGRRCEMLRVRPRSSASRRRRARIRSALCASFG